MGHLWVLTSWEILIYEVTQELSNDIINQTEHRSSYPIQTR